MTLSLTLAALALEAFAGYPAFVFRLIGHPVTWMGALIGLLDRELNRENWSFARRRLAGAAALAVLLLIVGAITSAVTLLCGRSWSGFLCLVVLCASLPAQRSLDAHVRAVAQALERDGIEAARKAVAMIVGRNPRTLDAAAIGRAAVESLAENFSDGVVAPAFWMALGGLPGAALYKAVNTADSMIGHKSERHRAFGWASARLDDLINLPASRLSAVWIILAALLLGHDGPAAVKAVLRDARHHRSPNAGWPEAAMAGALGLSIGGPRIYGNEFVEVAYMGRGRTAVTAADIRAALRLYRTACLMQWLALVIVLIAAG